VTYSNRVSTEVNGLLGDLQYTRSEAVKEGATVTICPSNSAQTQCVNSPAWQDGWIIFSDVNNNATVAAPDNILRVRAPFASTPRDSFLSDSGLIYVSFNREGFATSFPATPSGYVTFILHTAPSNAQWTRCVQVFSTGMMDTEKTGDAQGNCK
jgi:type IV fimbrial biogenesis protein FimT